MAENGITDNSEDGNDGKYATDSDHYSGVTVATSALSDYVIGTNDFYILKKKLRIGV